MTEGLPVTAGGAIFRRLHQLGVDHVFVNSGTDFPPIIEGLAEGEAHGAALPRSIVVPHEHVAMSMAHGHFFATGRPAAVILHTNVGLANGAIGAINAATDHVPMIVMSGRTPATEAGRFGSRTVPIGWGQEMRDQSALVREACKWDYEVRFPEQVPELLDRAYAIATSTPKGPVYLSLPREVLCEPCPAAALDAPPAMSPAVLAPNPDDLDRAAQLLAHAARPLIIAQRGAGSPAGFAALADIAERWSIPVCQWWAVATAYLRRAPDVRRSGPGSMARRGGCRPRRRQPRPVDARRPSPSRRLPCDPARSEPPLQPSPRAQLPLRRVDRDRDRPRSRRAGDSNEQPRRAGRRRGPTCCGRVVQHRTPPPCRHADVERCHDQGVGGGRDRCRDPRTAGNGDLTLGVYPQFGLAESGWYLAAHICRRHFAFAAAGYLGKFIA